MSVRELLHQVSFESDSAVLLPTTATLLREQSFIDGRTDFSAGQPRQIRLSDFIAAETAPAPPCSYIFHMAFGGSTLLSRLLDHPGQTLVLREPNALAQLANYRTAKGWKDSLAGRFAPAVNAVRRHLARRWSDPERIIVKPSNWVNAIIPELLADREVPAVLLLVSSRESFVRSVLRGGRDRVAFAARAAVHLSGAYGRAAHWVAQALAFDDSAADQLLRLACVLHATQSDMFESVSSLHNWGRDRWLDREELANDPVGVALRAARALELELPQAVIESNVARWLSRDAKDPTRSFSRSRQDHQDEVVASEYGNAVLRALDWASGALGPDRLAATP